MVCSGRVKCANSRVYLYQHFLAFIGLAEALLWRRVLRVMVSRWTRLSSLSDFATAAMTDVFSDRIRKAVPRFSLPPPVEGDSREGYFRKILDELPAAIYVTDALAGSRISMKQRRRFGAIVRP